MTDSSNPSEPKVISPHESLWARWGRQMDWRQNVEEQAVRKALDLPDNDMNLTVDKSVKTNNSGVSPLVAAGLGVGGALLGGGIPTALMLGSGMLSSVGNESVSKSVESTVKTESAVIQFYEEDAEGNIAPVNIDRIPSPQKANE